MSNLTRIIKSAAVAAGAALILPVLFGDPPDISDRVGEDAWRNLIYDFQTLFGAALAIGAAWWTVNTMDRTEVAAAKRHTDQMDLILHKDRLAIERAVYPQAKGLEGMARHLAQIWTEIDAKPTFDQLAFATALQSKKINTIAIDLIELLDREQLKEGSRLFDGMLAFKLSWLRARAITVTNVLAGVCDSLEHKVPIPYLLENDGVRDTLSDVYDRVTELAGEIPVIVGLMETTAARYGVAQQKAVAEISHAIPPRA